MIKMMFALNRNNFEGRREVTCYSCHRGARDPALLQTVENQMLSSSRPSEFGQQQKLPQSLPHRQPASIDRLHPSSWWNGRDSETLQAKSKRGTVEVSGKSVSVEVFTQTPDRRAVVRHLPAGTSIVAFNGHNGWTTIPGRPTRDMHAADTRGRSD